MTLSSYKSLLRQFRTREPRTEWLHHTRQELSGYIEARPVVRSGTQERLLVIERSSVFSRFFNARYMPVVLSALIIAILGGTGVAAQQSLPSSLFYPLKLATEQVRLVLTPSAEGKVKAHLDFANSRLAEVKSLSERGAPSGLITDTLSRYGSEVQAVTAMLPSTSTPSSADSINLALNVSQQLSDHKQALSDSIAGTEILNKEQRTDTLSLPTEAKDVAIRALNITQVGEDKAVALSEGRGGEVAAVPDTKPSGIFGLTFPRMFAAKPSGSATEVVPGPGADSRSAATGLQVISGEIKFIDIEGGCWYLSASNGHNYQLVGELANSLYKPGLQVKVSGAPAKDMATVCMVGELFKVEQVLESGEAGSKAGSTQAPPAVSPPKAD